MQKVLIVDDDPRICQLFEVTLKKAGYEVIKANDARTGLTKARAELPDLIISDYMMPDQDGEMFCKAVRADKEIAATPFIVITGRGTQKLKTDGLSKLFDDYLEKPVDLSFLVAKVTATLRRRNEEIASTRKKTTRLWSAIATLMIIILVAVGFASSLKVILTEKEKELNELTTMKGKYDRRILDIEQQLDSLGWELEDLDFERLNKELNQLIRKAKIISKELPEKRERDIVIRGIKEIMAEFGEENYIVPPLFASEVAKTINDMVSTKRSHTLGSLKRGDRYLPMIKQVLAEKNLPVDLAYIAMVESGFNPEAVNTRSGAAGMWQFMVPTAREYGLRINKYRDERQDPLKSTIAASEYLLDLIGVFGKKSVLLALASYNVGDGIVRYQLKKVYNPLEDRDFWYLFRKRALPKETREYIPKIIASIIIHKNAEHFGFQLETSSDDGSTQNTFVDNVQGS
ncbi:transglycosylase SLT domain-containing protein [candidate division KSB1 bacterium]|nr:transglycosylase SLT domain-containing protein [candidate division KSB1 bacterium]